MEVKVRSDVAALILTHPAGKAIVEAGKLLKAGKLAEVKKASAKDVRDEWAATSAADQRAESEEAAKSAPDTPTLAAEIARAGADTFVAGSAVFGAGKAADPHRYDSIIGALRAELAQVPA